MEVVRVHRHGPPDVLCFEEAPVPSPGPGQVLIKVESAGVNYADVKRRRNDPYPFPTPLLFIPGGEVAGTVEALGEGVGGPPLGTPVFALVGGDGSTGYAQHPVGGPRTAQRRGFRGYGAGRCRYRVARASGSASSRRAIASVAPRWSCGVLCE